METDLSLIKKIQEDSDEESLVTLIERHSGIYMTIVDQYAGSQSSVLDRSLIIDDKDFEIYRAAMKFDPDKKTKFSTHLANETKWKCLNMINRIKRKKEDGTPDNKAYVDKFNLVSEVSKIEAWETFYEVLDKEKDERVKKIIDIRYNTDNNKLTPWRLIAKKLNMSIQGCINIHNKFIKRIQTQLETNV